MKFRIEKTPLVKALTHIAGVIEQRTTIPILGCVKIATDGQAINLAGTDTDMIVSMDLAADVVEPGSIAVPAAALGDFVKRLPDGSQIEIAVDAGRMTLRCGRSRFAMGTMEARDFPVFSPPTDSASFSMLARDLLAMLDSVAFAMSTETTRRYLNGVCLDTTETMLRATATDGHQLARSTIAIPEGAERVPRILVGTKMVNVLRRHLDCDDEAHITIGTEKMAVTVGGTSIISKLVDMSFPDADRVIPSENSHFMDINRDDMRGAVSRVGSVSDAGGRAISLRFGGHSVHLTASGSAAAEVEEDVDLASPATSEFALSVNGRYLANILATVDTEMVRIALESALHPLLITGIDSKRDALFVLMPMRG